MGKIYELLLVCTAVLGLYVSVVLLFISKQNRLLNRLLATFSLSLSFFYLLAFCISRKWAPDFVILMRTFLPLFYILPASSYLYFRTYIQDDTRLSKKDLLHLVPFSIHILYICPLLYAIISCPFVAKNQTLFPYAIRWINFYIISAQQCNGCSTASYRIYFQACAT